MKAHLAFPVALFAILISLAVFQNGVSAGSDLPRAADLVAAGQETAPTTCTIGIYLTGLHDLDVNDRSFAADFWIWSVCPDDAYSPIESIDFVNADSYETTFLTETLTADGAIWTKAVIAGVFRHEWDLADFPFDRHSLRIEIEDGASQSGALTYQPDVAGTGHDPEVSADSWEIAGLMIESNIREYATTFGDPDQPAVSSSEFSRLVLTIDLERRELTGYFKLTAVLYASVLLALITYFLHLDGEDKLASRLGFVTGAIFTAALNMRSETAELGSPSELTMLDKLHIAGLFVILLSAVVAIASRSMLEHGRPAAFVRQINRVAVVASLVFFLGVNLLLIVMAA